MGKTLIILLFVSVIIGILIDRKIFKIHSCIWFPFLIVLVLSFPVFLTLLVKDIVKINFLPFNIIGTSDGWLGFLGAIVGLSGIWWQVTRHERKEKEKENREIVTLLKYFLKKNKEKNILFELQRELALTIMYTKKTHYYRLPHEFITNNISRILSCSHGECIMDINSEIEILLEDREKFLILSRKAYRSYNFKRVPLKKSLETNNEYLSNELNILLLLSELIVVFLANPASLKIRKLKELISEYDILLPVEILEGDKEFINLLDDLNKEIKKISEENDVEEEIKTVEKMEIELLEEYQKIINLSGKTKELYEKIKKEHLKIDVIILYDFLIEFYKVEEKKWNNLKNIFKLLESEENQAKTSTEMIKIFSSLFTLYGRKLINISASTNEDKIEEAELCMNLGLLIESINSKGINIYEKTKKYHEKLKT